MHDAHINIYVHMNIYIIGLYMIQSLWLFSYNTH